MAHFLNSYMQYLAGLGTVAVFSAKFFPNTFGLPYYKNFAQLYQKGFEVRLDKKTDCLAKEVLGSMNLNEDVTSKVQFFVAYGQDILSKGSVHSRYGALVGLPVNFRYSSVEDVEKRKLTVNNDTVDWESEAGTQLVNAMVLTEDAKKFAIAREIFHTRSFTYLFEGMIATGCFYASYSLGYSLSRSLQLKEKTPRSFRFLAYSLVGSLGFLLYILSKDTYNCYLDRKLDRTVVQFDPTLAKGGVEYFDQLLKRNSALRMLLGNAGDQKYTTYGNEAHTWRTPKVPLTQHRDFMLQSLKETLNQDSEAL